MRRVPASELVPHERNWRTHPPAQQAALRGLLEEIGYADALIARELPDGRLQTIDGHLRAETTPNDVVPVLVLDVTEAEADKLLLTLDPLAAMAEADSQRLDSLLREVQTDNEDVGKMLEELGKESGEKKKPEAALNSVFEIIAECQDESEQKVLYDRLSLEGVPCRVLSMPMGPDEKPEPPKPAPITLRPRVDIVLESPIAKSFRVEQVRGMFDVPNKKTIRHEWHVEMPLDFDWQIGLIVGPSGSGKTTIGRRLFPEAIFHEGYQWPEDKAIVDAFPENLEAKDIVEALSSVGFSSPPHWLKRFSHLSNGQRFRCELARLMLEDAEMVIVDEFTSIVDRDAAKISSAAVAKALRRRGKPRLVALSCHYDVLDWLDPNWVYNLADGQLTRRSLRRRPPVQLRICSAPVAAWELFRGHHYLSKDISRAARCFIALWNGTAVAFTSYVHMTGRKGCKRGHRTVVLPDYQGIGIGNALSQWLGNHCLKKGWRFYSVTSHPAMIRHRAKSPHWRMNRLGHVQKNSNLSYGRTSHGRLTAGFEFLG